MKPISAGLHAPSPTTAPHVVVVQEDREQPHVVARRLGLLVVLAADLPRLGSPGFALPSTLTSLNVSIVCGLPSSVTSKSSCVRSATGLPSLSGHDDVHAHEVDAGAEGRPAGCGCCAGLRRPPAPARAAPAGAAALRPSGSAAARGQHEPRDDHGRRARESAVHGWCPHDDPEARLHRAARSDKLMITSWLSTQENRP